MFDKEGRISSEKYNEFEARIKNVAAKLIIGHAFYDSSEFFDHAVINNDEAERDVKDYRFILSDAKFAFENNLSEETRNEFNSPIKTNITPEIGSRQFADILIMNQQIADEFYRWNVIQPNNYRYLTAPGLVRIVIREVLYIEGYL